MTRAIVCPDIKELERFLLGQLPTDVAREVETHFSGCQVCQATLHSVSASDTLLDAVRARVAAGPMPEGEEVSALVSRLKGIVPSSATAETEAGVPRVTEKPVLSEVLAPAQGPDEIGRLGPYRVLKLLGAGGMGMVFLAEDTLLGRKVALKTMLPAVAQNPQNRERFLREARAAATIEHPHIVAIFQVGEGNGVPFVAMPFLKGESLEDRLRRCGTLPVAEAIRIAEEMAEGLAAAHAEGLIHRDIKPGNVWLENQPARGTAEGTFKVKLLDFGLARSLTDDTHLTQSGAIVGTPAFMAPEQARGESVDGRADLFSLGCVLYAMLTGERPFRGENTMSLLMALALDTPKAPDAIDPLCPPDLARLTMDLLEKEPGKRPASARAVVDALAKIRGTDATEVIAIPAKTKAMPRKRRLLSLVAVGLMLTIAGVGVLFGGTIYRIATNKGDLVVEVEDKDVEVKIVRDGLVVQDRTAKREFTLTAGQGEIEVFERDGVKLATKQFELTRNGKTTVKVTLRELAAARGAKPKIELRPAVAGDRKAAEWVLSIGGKVRVNYQQQIIKDVAELPRGTCRLTLIDLTNNDRVDDAGLAHFEGCKDLTGLVLMGTEVGDAGLAHFKDCKNLFMLYLDGSRVSDVGLKHFKGCKKLTGIGLGGTRVTEAGLANFEGCEDLFYLDLALTEVTDAGLSHFKGCKKMLTLQLNGTKATDVGLEYFEESKGLTRLFLQETSVTDTALLRLKDRKDLSLIQLQRTKVSAAGIAELKKALPKCKIEWDGSAKGK